MTHLLICENWIENYIFFMLTQVWADGYLYGPVGFEKYRPS